MIKFANIKILRNFLSENNNNIGEEEIEESVDPRPLFQRLKEQKEKQECEWKEANKAFMDQEQAADEKHMSDVSKAKFMYELRLIRNDQKEIEEFRRKAQQLREEEREKVSSLFHFVSTLITIITFKLLKKQPTESMKLRNMKVVNKQKQFVQKAIKKVPQSALKTIAILPGIGEYDESSDSYSSSSSTSDASEVDTIVAKQQTSKPKEQVVAED